MKIFFKKYKKIERSSPKSFMELVVKNSPEYIDTCEDYL